MEKRLSLTLIASAQINAERAECDRAATTFLLSGVKHLGRVCILKLKDRSAYNDAIEHRKQEMTLKNVPLGEIIAERHLEAKDEAGEEREIIVRIGKPIPDPSPDANGAWCCPYEIVGFADNYLDAALGEDSMQALVLGLQKIVIKLSTQQKAEKLKLTWNGWENLDFTVRSEEDFYAWLMSEQYRSGMIFTKAAYFQQRPNEMYK